VKPFGPVQFHVVPPLLVAVKLTVCHTHNGVLLDRVGADGVATGKTSTVLVIAGQLDAVSLIKTVYVPTPTLAVLVFTPVLQV
jgi:hypothetical protein